MKRGLVEKTSICMIVLPLIALMKEQSTLFKVMSISAGCVGDRDKVEDNGR